jgi:hypothetical protein
MLGVTQPLLPINKLVLHHTSSRKHINITIPNIQVLKFLAKKQTDKQADDILASQITQAIEQNLAQNGQADAEWSVLTTSSSTTDVASISAALVMYLEEGVDEVLEGLADIADGTV